MLARTCTCGSRDRLDELEEENRQLKEMLAPSGIDFPVDWGLTEGERRILAGFFARGYLSHSALLAVSVNFHDRGDPHYTSVIICKIRRKLKPFGIEFENRFGRGYHLAPASRELIRKALAASEIVEAVKECFMPGGMT